MTPTGQGDSDITGHPLRWGVIGSGHIAGSFAQEMALARSGRVVAIGSRSQEAADRFGDQFDVPHRHISYQALAEDPDVDAVYVATPHPLHHDNALLALEAGKAVLVEKAFTMNADQARHLVDTARAKGLFLMEAMTMRFRPHITEIARLVHEGALGDIVTVTADLGHRFPPDPGSRFFAPELGGGALLDCGVYPLSLASMLLGRPSQVRALVTPAFTGVDGQTSMLLGFPSGAQAVLTCNFSADSPTRAAIVGTEARIEVDPPFFAPSSFTIIRTDGSSSRFAPTYEGTGLYYEADEVERCLRAGLTESPVMPLDESIWIMETMDAVLAQAPAGTGPA
jgi:predicted dehydrogenase